MQNRHWRKKPNETLIKLMEDSVDLKLYLVQEKGPLCLTFQDDDGKKFQISIGNEVSCSCGGGKTEHCIHTLFTLNRIFKIPFNDPLILQLHFTDSELNKLLENKNKRKAKENSKVSSKNVSQSVMMNNNSNQMSLIDDCVCPICQEDLYTPEGLYYCSNSCGHNFHVGCLRVFVRHKRDSDGLVTCPMCRAKWNEDELDKVLASTQPIKITKCHKGINCSNCSRTNIKFERFHCLLCESYDLCGECFANNVHKDKGHFFIMKKNSEEKWCGCDYRDFFEPNSHSNMRYVIKNIYLVQFLISCLSDFKADELEIEGVDLEQNKKDIQCAVCKNFSKNQSGKTIQFLMMKMLPVCHHGIHLKCCEKVFKLEQHNNKVVVDRLFNKCRLCSNEIFKGLSSIKVIVNSNNAGGINNSSVVSNNNLVFFENNRNSLPASMIVNGIPQQKITKARTYNNKRQIIQRLMANEGYARDNNNFALAFNIQKVNFDMDHDIQKFEMGMNHKGSNVEKKKIMKIPYRQVHSKVTKKKFEPIVARNKSNNTNSNKNNASNVENNFVVQKLPLMNSRPVRCESEHKVQLSPLLINMNDININ